MNKKQFKQILKSSKDCGVTLDELLAMLKVLSNKPETINIVSVKESLKKLLNEETTGNQKT